MKVVSALRRLALFAAGVRADILANAPTDDAFFLTLGMQVLVTSTMAAVSMTFALWSGMRIPVPVALAGGAVWGFVIFVVDRGLITSMKRNVGRRFGSVAGRVVLSVLLGAAIAEPLAIWVFRPEVERQVAIDRQERVEEAAQERTTGPRAKEVAANQAEVTRLQEQSDPVIPGGDAVRDRLGTLTAEVTDARTALDTAQLELTKEIEGLSATGRSGCGPACVVKTQARDQAMARLRDAETRNGPEIARLQQELSQLQADAVDQGRAAYAANLERIGLLEARTRDLQGQIDADFQAVVDRRSTGLLAQIMALHNVGKEQAAAQVAHLLLALLLITVDVLPVLNKIRYLSGPKRPYELLEEAVNARIGEQAGEVVDAAEHGRRVAEQLLRVEESARMEAEGETIRQFVEESARLQRELGRQSLRRWFEGQQRRTSADGRRPGGLRRLAHTGREDIA